MKYLFPQGLLFQTAAAAAPAGTTTPVVTTPTTTPVTTPATGPATTTPAAATTAVTTDPAQAAAGATTPAATAVTTPVVPEKYALTLPTGGPLDATDVTAIEAMAKERQWTNEQAQAALDEVSAQTTAQNARFLSTLQSHTEVGGAHLEAAQIHANRALDHFLPATTPEGAELRSVMHKSGYGNYAPFVVLLSRIGKAMGEDKGLALSASANAAPKSHADVLYGGAPIK